MEESDIFNVDRRWYNRKYCGILQAARLPEGSMGPLALHTLRRTAG